jgi:LuxR family transcriptional regulator, maltose regulon positive regulatory protein
MLGSVLATKLYKPPARSNAVHRRRLLDRLDEGRGQALVLVSAPAGFGKSTLLSAWVDERSRQNPGHRVAWLTLDEADSDPARFLLYVAAALHGAEPGCGADAMSALQSPQSMSSEAILTELVNEMDGVSADLLLVLDDYHAVRSTEVDGLLAFLLEHRPARLQVAVVTRVDPMLPLARLRARGELTEIRAADLRFSEEEAARFLRLVMGLELSADDVKALESRTEGWIAGLQLAALSLRAQKDASAFIRSFGGSHRFVLDYLGEEVLRSLPPSTQSFLLRSSILERFCGPLCDALVPGGDGQRTLEDLERANLFVVPLDGERRWYRYHRLFGELLRQRLEQSDSGEPGAAELHVRASEWFEGSGMLVDAFRHAAAAGDVDRAERLAASGAMPLHYRDAVVTVLRWLSSLPAAVLDARPSLRVQFASLSLFAGQMDGVEDALRAAEAGLARAVPDDKSRDLLGRIAAARATIAITRYQPGEITAQAERALKLLAADNDLYRLRVTWTRAFAHLLEGDRAAAWRAYTELEAGARASGGGVYVPLAKLGLGDCLVMDNELPRAADSYREGLRAFGEHPQPIASEMHRGLGHIHCEWNDLDTAEEHAERGRELAGRYGSGVDRFIVLEMLLARISLARGQIAAAATRLDALEEAAQRPGFRHRLPEIAALKVTVLLRQDRFDAAARLAAGHDVPLARARVLLSQGAPGEARAKLEAYRKLVEAKGWRDELLRVTVLQALTCHAAQSEAEALRRLGEALGPAEHGRFVRLFLDEGAPMESLLSLAAARGVLPPYGNVLRDAFAAERRATTPAASATATPAGPGPVEPLSRRERDVLGLLAEGLSNQEIGDRLFLALDTVKGHNRRIFEKLGVRRRTEAIARGRELRLL